MAVTMGQPGVHRLNLRIPPSVSLDLKTLAECLGSPEAVVGRAALGLGLVQMLRLARPSRYSAEELDEILTVEETALIKWVENKLAGRG